MHFASGHASGSHHPVAVRAGLLLGEGERVLAVDATVVDSRARHLQHVLEWVHHVLASDEHVLAGDAVLVQNPVLVLLCQVKSSSPHECARR